MQHSLLFLHGKLNYIYIHKITYKAIYYTLGFAESGMSDHINYSVYQLRNDVGQYIIAVIGISLSLANSAVIFDTTTECRSLSPFWELCCGSQVCYA